MGQGGWRPGAGRPGTAKPKVEILDEHLKRMAEVDITFSERTKHLQPVDILLIIAKHALEDYLQKGQKADRNTACYAAKEAAPFVHPRLQYTAIDQRNTTMNKTPQQLSDSDLAKLIVEAKQVLDNRQQIIELTGNDPDSLFEVTPVD